MPPAIPALDFIQYRFLKWISPQEARCLSGNAYQDKIKVLVGDQLFNQFRGKVVIDFGCGEGDEAIALAKNGASRIIGIDIRESVLQRAREKAGREGVERICQFCTDSHPGPTPLCPSMNQMTIARFEKLVKQSPFVVDFLEAVPIRRLRWLHNRLTREFTTSIVRCKLARKQ